MTLIKETTTIGQIIKLSNGLKVGNFSSPHPFTFEDGSVLPAVSDYDSMRLKVNFNETVVEKIRYKSKPNHIKDRIGEYSTVSLNFTLSDEVYNEMDIWQKMWQHNDVDIVLCPLPMIQALMGECIILQTPFRAVRMKDRIKKTSSIDTFCIGDSNGKAFRTLS